MYLLIFWRENSNIFHLEGNDARFARNRRQCRLFEWFSDTVVIEIEIWHCFNSVKGRRNICGVSWNCLVVSSPPFLIEVENPLLGRMMPPTSSLYHYGIVSHHSQKLAKITVYFFFLHQWRVGSLKTQCLKITRNVSFQNSREKSVFFFQMLFEFAAQNGQHYNFNLQFVKQYFFFDFWWDFQTMRLSLTLDTREILRETWHCGASIQTDEWTIVYRAWNRWWW